MSEFFMKCGVIRAGVSQSREGSSERIMHNTMKDEHSHDNMGEEQQQQTQEEKKTFDIKYTCTKQTFKHSFWVA